MKRSGLVAAVLVLVVAGLVWAGFSNLKARRAAMQKAQAEHTITAQPAGDASATSHDAIPELTGKPAPKFTLVTLEGKKVSLADYKGKPVLVNFWATWCAPCKLEMPWLEEFHKQYASQGFEVLGIAEDDASKDDITKTAQKLGVSYPVLLTDHKIATAYGGIDYLPESFYVDKNGTIVTETAGLPNKDEIEANIKKTIASGGM